MRPLGGFIEIALKSDQQSVLSTNGPSHKFCDRVDRLLQKLKARPVTFYNVSSNV